MSYALLGIGSNLGDRSDYLARATRALAECLSILAISPLYESPAMVPPDAPASWKDLPFLNAVLAVESHHAPDALLSRCIDIEANLGRTRHCRWEPRVIDIDILEINGQDDFQGESLIHHSATLTLPHPHLQERSFMLRPLHDIAPLWRYPLPGPLYGMTAQALLTRLSSDKTRLWRQS